MLIFNPIHYQNMNKHFTNIKNENITIQIFPKKDIPSIFKTIKYLYLQRF